MQHLAESQSLALQTHTASFVIFITVNQRFHRKQIFIFSMLQAKYTLLLLFVATLLTVSCQSREHEAEQGTKSGENATASKLETFDFAFNSTNMTHFVYGISANMVAVLLYGSNFVPVKRIETGDGMFFQWINCAAIWVVSMIGDLMLQSPKFYPFAMLGGVIWATGNITAVPIVKAIGLGLGILIWGSSSLLMGWASSRFGWFGITAQDVSRPILNYCGAGLCLLSGLIFFFVRTDVELHPNSESIPLLIDRRTHSGSYGPSSSEFWIDVIGPKTRRFIGCLLAVMSGLLYGSSFIPILYIKNHSSCHDSIFHGASVYGLLSGLMWALATYCWFLANNYLSAVITFPIVSAGYGLVAALWGSLVFKEIKALYPELTFGGSVLQEWPSCFLVGPQGKFAVKPCICC
uniref:transmembrane protein 144-like isoform X3 n=1 Tax=Scatophagus argus TaxID=75038 RepID=UPI001ED83B3B|nr:transmembrane protein 144-like isoform X3 [Scatophagus argus]